MNVTRNYNKKGKLISFRVSVYMGHDENGKEIRKKITIKIPNTIRASKVDDYICEKAIMFEKQCKDESCFTSDITFEDYAIRALEVKQREGLKRSTLERYEDLLGRINPAIGKIKIQNIKPMHLNDFYGALSQPGVNKKTGGGLSSKTIKEHHRLISSILELAVTEELINKNPALNAKPPKVIKKEVECFTEEEVRMIRECAKGEQPKWSLMIDMLIVTGGRRAEVVGLKWSSIDLETGIIHIHDTILYSSQIGIYEDTTKTEKSDRYLKLTSDIVEKLKRYKKMQEEFAESVGDAYTPSDYVFTKVFGGPMHPDSVTDYLRKFARKYKLPHINPKKFRHTAASILIFKNIDIVTVSKYLGHSNPTTTANIYSHAYAEGLAKASEAIGEVLLE